MSCSLLSEAFLGQSATIHAPFATQSVSASADAALFAAKLQSSVLLLDPDSLHPQQCFTSPTRTACPPGVSSSSDNDTILGVVLSPTGAHAAAYTTQHLLVATVNKRLVVQQQQQASSCPAVGQFQSAAVLSGGIRSVHWGPGGTVLAVCSRGTVREGSGGQHILACVCGKRY
jgi:hypothetical protein